MKLPDPDGELSLLRQPSRSPNVGRENPCNSCPSIGSKVARTSSHCRKSSHLSGANQRVRLHPIWSPAPPLPGSVPCIYSVSPLEAVVGQTDSASPQLRLPSRPWPPALARSHRGSSAAELFSVFGAPPSRRFHFRPRFRQSCCRAVRGNRRRRWDACPVLHPTPPVTPCSSEGLSEPAPPLLWLCGNHVHLQFSSSRATLISNIRSLSIGINSTNTFSLRRLPLVAHSLSRGQEKRTMRDRGLNRKFGLRRLL